MNGAIVTDEWIVVGRVARPHGIRGHVIVNPDTDFPDQRFRPGATLSVASPGGASGVEYRIVSVRFHLRRPILELEGVESMSAAEALAGAELRLPMAALDQLPEGTFYHHQLIGCEVHDRAGLALGRVRAIEGPMERSRLVVAGERGEIQIPMTEGIMVSVDPAAGRIVVDPPDGLVELNAASPRT
jgi:16S rRNA processing protein RimM